MSEPVRPRGMKKPKLQIRKAEAGDLDALLEVVADAQRTLREAGVDQWQNGYPNREVLRTDMENGVLYIAVRDGLPVGMAALIDGPDPTYTEIDGAWPDEEPYLVIHRIAVHSALRRAGIAGLLLQKAEDLCRERGLSSVRVDTHKDNRPMNGFLTARGFTRAGVIRLADGAPREAYHKSLSED